ncbi:hypothetical protein ACIXR2_06490 [Bacteroides fragilis]
MTVSPDKEATGNTLSNEVGEEDFPVASASGPCRDWQPAIELCRKISGLSAWSVSGERL